MRPMIRTMILAGLALTATGCASALERQAGAVTQEDCWDQADAYIHANLASIPNEWREHEKYKHYQQCLADHVNASS